MKLYKVLVEVTVRGNITILVDGESPEDAEQNLEKHRQHFESYFEVDDYDNLLNAGDWTLGDLQADPEEIGAIGDSPSKDGEK